MLPVWSIFPVSGELCSGWNSCGNWVYRKYGSVTYRLALGFRQGEWIQAPCLNLWIPRIIYSPMLVRSSCWDGWGQLEELGSGSQAAWLTISRILGSYLISPNLSFACSLISTKSKFRWSSEYCLNYQKGSTPTKSSRMSRDRTWPEPHKSPLCSLPSYIFLYKSNMTLTSNIVISSGQFLHFT